MLVVPRPHEIKGSLVRLPVRVLPERRPAFEVAWRFPVRFLHRWSGSADAFAVAFVFFAMHSGERLRIEGRVSPSLLANLERFQEIWTCWRPDRYRTVPIEAAEEREEPRADPGTSLALFSGGVDAAFSTLLHHRREAGRRSRRIEACVLAGGMGGFQGQAFRLFEAEVGLVSEVLASLGIPLLSISSNWQLQAGRLGLDIRDLFVTGFVACLYLLRGQAGSALLAAGETSYRYTAGVDGSSPLTDPLLGSTLFPILHEGCAHSRVEKLRLLGTVPELLRILRVCNRTLRDRRNCGCCEKCLRTALACRIAGVAGPEGLGPPSCEALADLEIPAGYLTRTWRDMLAEARGVGLEREAWFGLVESKLPPVQAGSRG